MKIKHVFLLSFTIMNICKLLQDIKKDAFGRIQNQASGILYNVLHGRAFIWCDPFLPFLTHAPTKKLIGDVFCK